MLPDPTFTQVPDYELGTLDYLILEQINPENSGSNISIDLLYSTETKTADEIKNVRYRLAGKAFETLHEERTRVLIKNYQRRLRNQINELSNYIDISLLRKEKQAVEVYYKIQTHISSLLLLLSREYDEFFDFSAKADMAFKKKYAEMVLSFLDDNQLNSEGIQSQILEIIIEPMKMFISDYKKRTYSYQFVLYLYDFIELLRSLNQTSSCNDLELELIMMKYNFNSSRFLNYKIDQIRTELSSRMTLKERLEYLYLYQKEIRQMEVLPDRRLFSEQRTIPEQISGWISEELELAHNTFISNQLKASEGIAQDEKIQSQLSVPQLALLVRLMVETRIIENPILTTVFKAIVNSFKTKHSEHISIESFRTKYYNNESNAIVTMKDTLIKMLNVLNKMS